MGERDVGNVNNLCRICMLKKGGTYTHTCQLMASDWTIDVRRERER